MSRKILGAFVAILALTEAAAAQTCTLPSVADTVDLKQVPGSDLMTVPVEINGTPKQFLLDIGTNPTEVSQAAVTELGLPENVKMLDSIQTGGTGGTSNMGGQQSQHTSVAVYDVKGGNSREQIRTRVRIASFTIGSATNHAMQFLVAKDVEMGKSEPYDGLMTGDFFRQYDVELDFAGKQINYLTPTKCIDPDQVVFWSHSDVAVVPITMADDKIQVQVLIEGHAINAVIDTSSARTVLRRDIAELVLGFKADAPEMMSEGDLKDGMGAQVYHHTFSKIAFAGGVTAVNVPVLISTNSLVHEAEREVVLGSKAMSAGVRIPDLELGMDVLHQLHLYAVFGQKKLYITAR